MSNKENLITALKNINIASYALTAPTLALSIGLLLRMLISSDRGKFCRLIIILILMIISWIASMTGNQLAYNFAIEYYDGEQQISDFAKQGLEACFFVTTTTFNLAHWFFAFSYFDLSHRFGLIAQGLPEHTHNLRLNTTFIIGCLFNLAPSAVFWAYNIRGLDNKGSKITLLVE